MAIEMVNTELEIYYVPTWGDYSSIRQENHIMQYPLKIYEIVFFHVDEQGKYSRLGKFSVEREFAFSFKSRKLEKPPVKRKENATKNEMFFFIGNTLYLRDIAVELVGPEYTKKDLRNEGVDSLKTDEANFALIETFTWNNDSNSKILLYDSQDYSAISGDAEVQLHSLSPHSWYFRRIEDIVTAKEILTELEIRLKARMDWWDNATTSDILAYYKSLLRGGKSNA